MDEFSSLLDVAGSYCKSRAANLVKNHIFASLMGPYSSTISNFICVNGRSDKDWSAEYRLYSKERVDADSFYPPSEHHVTKNGRPRSYGDRAPTPEELRQNDSILCKEVEAVASGRRHTFRVKEIKNLLWRPAGAKISVRVIVIAPTGYRLRKGSKLLYRQPAYLLCTDDNLPIEEVLQYYLWRWGVEVNFRDVKELIGVGDAMVRTEPSNRILPAVLVGGYSLLWIAALKMMSKEVNPVSRLVAPKWRAELEANRTKPSTGQLLRQIRAECLSEAIESYTFDGFVSGKVMDTKPKKLGIKLRGIIQTA